MEFDGPANLQDLKEAFANQLQKEELRARRALRVFQHQQQQLMRLQRITTQAQQNQDQDQEDMVTSVEDEDEDEEEDSDDNDDEDDKQNLVDLLRQNIRQEQEKHSLSGESLEFQSFESNTIDKVERFESESEPEPAGESLSNSTDSIIPEYAFISTNKMLSIFFDGQNNRIPIPGDKNAIEKEMNSTRDVLLSSQRKLESLEKKARNIKIRGGGPGPGPESDQINLLRNEISEWKSITQSALRSVQEASEEIAMKKNNRRFWETSIRFFSPEKTMFFLTAKKSLS